MSSGEAQAHAKKSTAKHQARGRDGTKRQGRTANRRPGQLTPPTRVRQLPAPTHRCPFSFVPWLSDHATSPQNAGAHFSKRLIINYKSDKTCAQNNFEEPYAALRLLNDIISPLQGGLLTKPLLAALFGGACHGARNTASPHKHVAVSPKCPSTRKTTCRPSAAPHRVAARPNVTAARCFLGTRTTETRKPPLPDAAAAASRRKHVAVSAQCPRTRQTTCRPTAAPHRGAAWPNVTPAVYFWDAHCKIGHQRPQRHD